MFALRGKCRGNVLRVDVFRDTSFKRIGTMEMRGLRLVLN